MYISKRVVVAFCYWMMVFAFWFAADFPTSAWLRPLVFATLPWSWLLVIVAYPVLYVLPKGGPAMMALYFVLLPLVSGGLNAAMIGFMVRTPGGRWPVAFHLPVRAKENAAR
jgi:hypothetical protein